MMKQKQRRAIEATCQKCGETFLHRSSFAYYCERCRIVKKMEQAYAWARKHPEQVKATQAAWREKNQEQIRAQRKEYYAKHPRRVQAANKKVYWRDPVRARQKVAERRARMKAKQAKVSA